MSPSDAPVGPAAGTRKGWIVAGAMFLMLGIVITGRNSLGLMMPFWQQDLGWSYGFVATAGAAMLTVMALLAPGAGLLLDRFGARAVYAIGMTLIGLVFILLMNSKKTRRSFWFSIPAINDLPVWTSSASW